jgi:hypothetical protein
VIINRFTQRPKTSHLDEILALIDEAVPCPHTSTTVAETGPEDHQGGTSAYLVCEDCGAELEGPWSGSGVL